MTYPVITFEAAILYDTSFRLPDYEDLHRELNQRLGRAGNSVTMNRAQTDTYLTFRSDNLYIAINFNRAKRAPETLSKALSAGINQMRNPKFAHYVDDHIETITISVGDGRLELPGDLRQMMEKAGFGGARIDEVVGGKTGVDPRIKISVLHSAVETILETITPRPTVVHWCDTDLLYTADDFPPLTLSLPFPVTLTAQTQFINTGLTSDGRQTHAILMQRSELLCGRTLFADTTTYDPEALLAAMHLIMLSHIIGGKQLADGATGSFDDRTGFRIEDRPPHELTPAGAFAMLVAPLATTQDPFKAWTDTASEPARASRGSWWRFGKKHRIH